MIVSDHGDGTYVAILADGTPYVVRPGVEDSAPLHRELAEAIRAGTVTIVPAPERDPEPVRRYYLDLIDAEAARRAPSSTATHALKLEEARNVLDRVDVNGDGQASPEEVAAANADVAAAPLLAMGIRHDGPDLVACARRVVEAANAHRIAVASIERKIGRAHV